MKKKYSLTDEHRAQFKPWADKWIANAMSTKAMDDEDRQAMRVAIRGLYEAGGKEPPPENRIVFVSSPFVARFAGGFAAGIWQMRKGSAATYAATRAATDAATDAATSDATREATRAATRDATYAATSAATYAATDAATYDATSAATRDATDAATSDATDAATDAATSDATYAATDAATSDATDEADQSLDKWYVINGDVAAIAHQFGNGKFLLQCAAMAWRMYQGGNQWSGWTAYLSFFRNVAKLALPIYEKFKHWEAATIHGSYRIMHEKFCIVSDRPKTLTVDTQNRPHNETGPFCEWRDGSKLYSWHGIRVPAWCIEQKSKITKKTILAEQNSEIRRAMCEIVGWTKALEMFGGKTIHADECLGLPRELKEIDLNGERTRILIMHNGTVENGERRKFVEGVPTTVDTCHAAMAWQIGVNPKFYKETVRT